MADLDARLKAVVGTLGRRPLLIADQFDDYQARHHDQFLAQDGTWLVRPPLPEPTDSGSCSAPD